MKRSRSTMINSLPFYPVFEAFLKYGYALGIPEYEDFIRVLRSTGIYTADEHIISRNELLEICKLLWLKPGHVPFTFEDIFNDGYQKITWTKQIIAQQTTASGLNESPQIPAQYPGIPPTQEDEPFSELQEEEIREEENHSLHELHQGDFFRILVGEGEKRTLPHEKQNEGDRKFLFSRWHYPVSDRSMQQLLRKLPERRWRPAAKIIDIQATIEAIAEKGYLDQLYYFKESESVNQVLVFHDRQGSMVAFENLSELIGTTIKSLFRDATGKKREAINFYFHNVIEEHVYTNKSGTGHLKLGNLIKRLKGQKTACIIISDAGAARGSNRSPRVNRSISMLLQLERISTKIIWLNPMPASRWENTSAARIAGFVPMFEISHQGIANAVDILRGKQNKPGK